jgi:REP element-mobilizing transposase RayT
MPSEKYRGKYRIPSSRLKNYDYGKNGAYFVTIVTKNRQNFFGEIQNGKMVLSEMGKMAKKYWYEIPRHFPFVRLDAFVVMPNHIHGILWIVRDKQPGNISETGAGKMDGNDGMDGIGGIVETPKLGVSTKRTDRTDRTDRTEQPPRPGQSVPTKNRNKNHRPEWKPATLGVIINQYKRICTIQMRKQFPGFGWQSRFHDRIIRNKRELDRIRRYIQRNPEIWWRDRNNPDR